MIYYAHSTDNHDKSDWQLLAEHLINTARLAAAFGRTLGIDRAVHLAGKLHDLGKYVERFQARLEGAPDRVDHSTAGAAQVLSLAKTFDEQIIAELIAYAIAGHHAGLPDKNGSASLDERVKDVDVRLLDSVWEEEIDPDMTGVMPELKWHEDPARRKFQLAFLGRMIFSCLVDADFKDTERFYCRVENRTKDRDWPDLQDILPILLDNFETHMAGLQIGERTINHLRSDILTGVRAAAEKPPGLFTLTVPTGGGKTLASLGFALEHAKKQSLRRIIYAIPFTSIIDQTVDVFKDTLKEDIILEHHSAIEEEAFGKRQQADKLKLAMEDWAAPIVVTTNVQLFESLFAARPGRCRKLHNIAGSVIILDEAQTLPRHLLAPSVRAIDELAHTWNCSVVLCTATQPALDERNFKLGHPMGLKLEGRELASDPARLFRELKRVTISRAGEMTNDDLVIALRESGQGLVIVNSRAHALDLYNAATGAGLEGVSHLTTRQYAVHRRRILETIRARLKAGKACRVIATSLVEAGVDLDFPLVWRAETGLDQIAQAAGRCNREDKRDAHESIVTVFSPRDYPPPAELRKLAGAFERVCSRHEDLLSPEAIADYFGEVYWQTGAALDRERILEDFRIDRTGTDFAYRTVAEKFRMIENGMAPVIIARDDKAMKAVEKLSIEQVSSGAIARDLQPYIVLVPPKSRDELVNNGHVSFREPALRGDQFAVLETPDLYREETGLQWEEADELGMSRSIF